MSWLLGTETLQDAITRTGGRSRGFDYFRIFLSCAVVVWHSARVSYPDFGMGPWLRPTAGLILPCFFALSGYLVSGSLIRSRTVHEFVALRAMRIVPALAVETVLSMVIIGSLFTTLSLGAFYSHPQTHAYLFNIVGYVHFKLPGVFTDLPINAVNLSLWTVPFELECYLLIVILWVTRIIRSPLALLLAAIGLQIAIPAFDLYRGVEMDATRPVAARVLVLAFLYGVLLYNFRDRLRLNGLLLIVSLAACLVCLRFVSLSYFVALPAAYVTIYLGLLNLPKVPVVMDGDYSYGIYLYSFPIQQAITQLLPDHREWYVNAPISLVLAAACAAFSWHVVEKPVLQQRKRIIAALDHVADRLRGRRPRPAPVLGSVLDIKSEAAK